MTKAYAPELDGSEPHEPRSTSPHAALLPLCALLLATGCAATNRLELPVRIETGPYEFDGEELTWWAGVPDNSAPEPAGVDETAPVLVFVEGDGGQCQRFSEGLWRRFLIRNTGRFVLVRPRTRVNVACETPRWETLDFLHRVQELKALVARLRQAFPGRPVFLLGHSAGAHVARLLLEQEPEAAAGIINVSGGYDSLLVVLEDIAATEPSAREPIEAFLQTARTAPPREKLWARTAVFWRQMLFSEQRSLWQRTSTPCVVFHGTEDSAVPWVGVERAARALEAAGGRCRLTKLVGVSHDALRAALPHIDVWLREGTGSPAP